MKAAIIGGRGAGKSTVFHALTGLAPLEGQSDAKSRARFGQIKIPDPRLDFLESTYGSKKKVQVELTLMDFAPNPKEQKAGAALDPSLLPMIREPDALLIVIPAFGAAAVDLIPAVESVEAELVFADFEQGERRLERLKKEKGANDFERVALEKCLRHLEQGAPLRKLELSEQETQVLATFCFLSQKPALVVINCDTEQAAAATDAKLHSAMSTRGLDVLKLAAAFEAELWELEPEAQRELLSEAGLKAPARDRLIATLYGHLGLMTFYTAGEPEAHAWSLRRGASALEAAARIHSDIARGFIRAEVVSYEDFAALRSDAKVKEAGKLRLEGKDYLMRDGDIIHIRFKV
ncbi:MAG TPA: DUF933 domain-containing protein [Candidatus Binataceae bacterium]|nr:DUF933 domain-containing protein [Candidatus Binataceae bacterium]